MLNRSVRAWSRYTFSDVCNGSARLSWARADFLHERGEPLPNTSQHGHSSFAWAELQGYDTLVVKPCVDMCIHAHAHVHVRRAAAVTTNVPYAPTRYGGTHTGGAGQLAPAAEPRAVRALHAYYSHSSHRRADRVPWHHRSTRASTS